ncbi:MAG: hypothetical protein ACNS62_11250 [Candidatus Cyclobacteriaceae bacterium M3_2C_046]
MRRITDIDIDETQDILDNLPEEKLEHLIIDMGESQPYILAYLMAVEHDTFSEEEREFLLYMGIMIWKAAGGKNYQTKVSDVDIETAEEMNLKMLEYLLVENDAGFQDFVSNLLNSYHQSSLLKFVVTSIMEEQSGHFDEENFGALFITLKTIIDCMDNVIKN